MHKLYLAGGKDQAWRDRVENRLGDRAKCFNPFRDARQNATYEFTEDDLSAIRHSDAVLGFCDYHRYTGMALEFGFAHGLGLPIYYVPFPGRIDAMMAAVSSAVFTDLNSMLDFVDERVVPE